MKKILLFVGDHKTTTQALLTVLGFGLIAVGVVTGGIVKTATFGAGIVIILFTYLWVGQ